MNGLSIMDYYPKSYVYKPSERMKRFWKEHEDLAGNKLVWFYADNTTKETK